MTDDFATLARESALPYYEDALPAHDAYHAGRVRDLSVRLAGECEESVDTDLLAAAAWLHDIGRPLERKGEIDHHDQWAATEARDLLGDAGVAPDRLDDLAHCLRAHSIRSSSPEPETVEGKLLFDADKLDAAGAVGIVRLACIVGERSGRAGERHARIDRGSIPGLETDVPDVGLLREWTRERLDRLYTDPARRLGERRWEFTTAFFERVERETGIDGDR